MAYKNRQKGFTIIELMIAISVFAAAVVLITMGVLLISRQYQQGSTRTKLESANREVHQTFTQAVQFANGTYQTNSVVYAGYTASCIGTKRFIYGSQPTLPYDESKYNSLNPGLYIDSVDNKTCPNTSNPKAGTNLLPPGAKVVQFDFDDVQKKFTTKFVSSPGDLLDYGTLPEYNIKCNSGIAGREFCAVVQLTSSAIQRVSYH